MRGGEQICRWCSPLRSISAPHRPAVMFVRVMIMHFGSTHIHQTNGQQAHTFVWSE
jgi:hypothetical protein